MPSGSPMFRCGLEKLSKNHLKLFEVPKSPREPLCRRTAPKKTKNLKYLFEVPKSSGDPICLRGALIKIQIKFTNISGA